MTDATRIRALVIDDEPLARDMIREMLAGDPEVEIVAECANGREAVEAIRSLSPDLIFLDIQMPELGGFEVLESFEANQVPYVIFATAYDQYAVRAFEVHAFDYLLKPFDQERFDAAWQRAKAQVKLDRTGERDRHILALPELFPGAVRDRRHFRSRRRHLLLPQPALHAAAHPRARHRHRGRPVAVRRRPLRHSLA